MYLDDGVSRSSGVAKPENEGGYPRAKSEYRETKITHKYIDAAQKTRELKIERVHDNYRPEYETFFFVAILHDPSETQGSSGSLNKVILNNQEIQKLGNGDDNALNGASLNAWYYNPTININFIKVFDNLPSVTITLEYA
jgi:alpha-glucosidase